MGVVKQAFNLANIGIPASHLLLDRQLTIHLVYNPSLLCNICAGPSIMAVYCNSGTVHTTCIGDLLIFESGTMWHHPGGISNILSLAMLHKHNKEKYEDGIGDGEP